MPATTTSHRRRHARQAALTTTGADEVVGWTRDSQQVLFRAVRGEGTFPT
jgi:hypothetical protein